ncbi:MAG: hypothetical protein LBD79_00910 [Treponema sp.]|nr:hypothetical protein [Treponema sp.]
MSYKQTYSASVPYSGTISYTYPASKNGGSSSISYHGEVPLNVTINVNTNPFDSSVNNCNKTIDYLTGSVVAMNAAQSAAIRQTAKEVSKSLIDGFFGVINTELSQQLQALDSAIKVSLGLIQEQSQAVSTQKNVMETDYNRISSRYLALFANLDNECYKRIYAMDKQSFYLSEKAQKQLLIEQNANAAALSLLGILEESSSKIFLLVSRLNRKVKEVLKTLVEYITQEHRLNFLVDSFLFNEVAPENIPVYVPVICVEADVVDSGGANSGATFRETFMPEYLEGEQKKAIAGKTGATCPNNSIWRPLETGEKEMLNKEFNALAEQYFEAKTSEIEQRVYKTMLSLWQNSNQLSLGGSSS